MHHSLETRIWFLIVFLTLKESLTLFQTWIFCWPSIILSHVDLSRIDLPKLTKYFNGNYDNSSCPGWWMLFLYAPPHKGVAFWKNLWAGLSFSYSLKITYILLRQVISLKKMVVLSVSFTILILCSPVSFNPFISINEIGKYHSHNIV